MVTFFTAILNNSITATVIALILIGIRACLGKRLPATFCYLLWSILWIRLIIPYSLSSIFSVFNILSDFSVAEPLQFSVVMEYTSPPTGQIMIEKTFWNMDNLTIMTAIWATVVVILLIYASLVYVRTHCRLAFATIVKNCTVLEECQRITKTSKKKISVYRSSLFDTPVVVGVLHPRIILPNSLDMDNREQLIHILCHELAHLKRKDHVLKTLNTISLILHWFNPMVWLCYHLYTKDIEASCDEYVLFHLGEKYKKGYIYSLISLAAPRSMFLETPLAFSETGLEQRVHAVAKYKKMGKMKTTLIGLLIFIIGMVTMTNPVITVAEYIPASNVIGEGVNQSFQQAAMELTFALNHSDSEELAALTTYREPHFAPFFQWIEEESWTVTNCQLYTDSEEIAYVYITVKSNHDEGAFSVGNHELVATLQQSKTGQVVLTQIQPKQWFDQHMTVVKNEPSQLIENLHQFDIYNGFTDVSTIPKTQIAAFCINEEYEDRMKSGELEQGEYYIKPEWLAYSAQRYFGIEDFSYTFDDSLYDYEKDLYIYSPSKKEEPKSRIIAVEESSTGTEITAQIYSDPLQMVLDKTVTYTLKKDRG